MRGALPMLRVQSSSSAEGTSGVMVTDIEMLVRTVTAQRNMVGCDQPCGQREVKYAFNDEAIGAVL